MKKDRVTSKQEVFNFWNSASCGESLYLDGCDRGAYDRHAKIRYTLEGEMIDSLANFKSSNGLKVLEIGVGLGADHQRFAEAGAKLFGVDLTERAVEHTKKRLLTFNLTSDLSIGDAENLNFSNNMFDQVYSWGVLHHSPDTPKAISEVWRVLKPGGIASIMIYHKWSIVGAMLWMRYGLFKFRPWISLGKIYSIYLESPGTKAYSTNEAKELFKKFSTVKLSTPLTHGDLLDSDVGQRHRGLVLMLAKSVWPRWLIKRLLPNSGLFMLIEARK